MACPPRQGRNHLIDAARIASVLLVIVFHVAFFRITLADGHLSMIRWQPTAPWWPATWVAMLLPLFFVAGGYANDCSLGNVSPGTAGVTRFLVVRGVRIAGPLALFTGVVATVATVAAWLPGTPPPTPYPGSGGADWPELAGLLSRDYCAFLWFITVYLVIVASSPLLVRLHERFGFAAMLVLACGAGAVDAWSAATGILDLRYLNWLTVWPLAHQFGVAYHRGWFREGPLWAPLCGLVGGSGGVAGLIAWAGYPGSAIVSYYPPTVMLAFLALAQVSALGLLERGGCLRTVPPRVGRVLGSLNEVLVTIFLWETTAIILATAALVGLGTALPSSAGALVRPIPILGASLLVLAGIVPPLAAMERRLVPALGDRQRLVPALAGFGMLVAGTGLSWTQGLLLHPVRPWAGLAVVLTLGGAALLVRAAGGPASSAADRA